MRIVVIISTKRQSSAVVGADPNYGNISYPMASGLRGVCLRLKRSKI
jgi:hypothetical protein